MFIFLDESGDLGFDWGKKNTSSYFTVTLLLCHTKTAADKIRQIVRRTLRNKLNHRKANRREKELKGTGTSLPVKRYFYQHLPENEWEIYSVTLNKKRVLDHLKTKTGKKKLYNFLARFLIEQIPLYHIPRGQVDLVLDKCKNTEEIKDFNSYLENHIQGILPLNTLFNIEHESSIENPCLQAVDMFCWGIFRKYAVQDRQWYDCFKDRVKFETVYLKEKG